MLLLSLGNGLEGHEKETCLTSGVGILSSEAKKIEQKGQGYFQGYFHTISLFTGTAGH
jgi:hypothetical protein